MLAEVQVRSWWRRIGRPASLGSVVAADERGDLAGPGVLVGQRQQRDVHADHRADRRDPRSPRSDTTMSAGITPASVRTPVTRPPPARCRRPRCRAAEARAARLRRAGPGPRPRARPWPGRRSGCAARRGPRSRSSSGCSSDALVGVDDPASTPQDVGPALPAVQVGQPFRGGGDLQPADLVEAPRAVEVEAGQLLDRVAWRTRSSSWTGWSGTPARARARSSRRSRAAGPGRRR